MSINDAKPEEWDAAWKQERREHREKMSYKMSYADLKNQCGEFRYEDAPLFNSIKRAPFNSIEPDGSGNPKARVGALKAPLHLVPPALSIGVAYALKDGAAKYGAYNWREEPINVSTYIGAIQRHMLAYQDGEDVAEDSGVCHLAHAAACIALLMDSKAHGSLVDDRHAGPASKVLKEYMP